MDVAAQMLKLAQHHARMADNLLRLERAGRDFPGGLRVVNLFSTRDLEWTQILRVGFSGGAPWAVLELTDTEEQFFALALDPGKGEAGAEKQSA